jgi:hypothetical protein
MYRDSQYGLTIDVTGPEGNVYNIFAIAQSWCKQLGWDWPTLEKKMKERGDYHGVLTVFRDTFKNLVTVVGYDFDTGEFEVEDDA